MSFPLEQWFDVTKRIPWEDVEDAEAQMALYAVKSGQDPASSEAKQQYRELREAVKQHNAGFRLVKAG